MEKSSRFTLAILFAVLVLGGAGGALIFDTLTQVPDFSSLKKQVKVPIELSNKEKSFRMMGPNAPGWVPLTQISNAVIGAVVSSEDTSFFSNEGVDYHELKEALKKDLEEGRFARGASTLTQQVVKNVYLGQEKTLWRKFKEFFWAQKMAKVIQKTDILAFYLNMAEWGPGLYGIRDAAHHYFSSSPAEISPKQAAFLALLLPSPKKYHSYFQNKKLSPWAQSRVDKILKVMLSMKFIDQSEYERAQVESLWEVSDSWNWSEQELQLQLQPQEQNSASETPTTPSVKPVEPLVPEENVEDAPSSSPEVQP